MIPSDIVDILIIAGTFILAILLFLITRGFWKTTEQKDCSYCKGELTKCKITIIDESGTKVYCNPDCLALGLIGHKYAKNKP